jgi:hypothetical protein
LWRVKGEGHGKKQEDRWRVKGEGYGKKQEDMCRVKDGGIRKKWTGEVEGGLVVGKLVEGLHGKQMGGMEWRREGRGRKI